MGEFTELTLKKVERILEGLSSGKHDFVAVACQSERLSRTTFYEWRNACPQNKKRLYDVLDNHRIVEAEDSLFKEVKRGNITALIFFLCNRVPSRWRRGDPPYEAAETPESLPVIVRLYCDDKDKDGKELVKG
ncbi:MAG: hypothetical protein ABH891_05255 [Candidatus Omnitrophota bacterium]